MTDSVYLMDNFPTLVEEQFRPIDPAALFALRSSGHDPRQAHRPPFMSSSTRTRRTDASNP
ncbi:hypothetical protein [Chelativorans salis]|uniref:Uncharacterized protein n=1 Tax=Chelativorans salis TaxID=2978478 RepID=A0ABT2LHM4_9HYPH|nr:hypothetical protein [Chelativorans sp. EGI FJ00035]MCT7373764.1 hypothetical protein [Chelativorans sp. EGI FJ00035]